ncbi:hypothetical protein ACFX1R_036140 [Malus domestica]
MAGSAMVLDPKPLSEPPASIHLHPELLPEPELHRQGLALPWPPTQTSATTKPPSSSSTSSPPSTSSPHAVTPSPTGPTTSSLSSSLLRSRAATKTPEPLPGFGGPVRLPQPKCMTFVP